MTAQNFKDWWNEHRDSMLEWDWDCVAEAAWLAAEEKFNSALRQPTQQGSEPSEISAFVNWVASLSKTEYAAHEQLVFVINAAQKLLPC